MQSGGFALMATLSLLATSCGGMIATTHVPQETLISAVASFSTRDESKEADSAVTVDLLSIAIPVARARTSGTAFVALSTSEPMPLVVVKPFMPGEVNSSALRLRFATSWRDTWYFDVGLTLAFSDGTTQRFYWSDIRLNVVEPEKTLSLASGRVP